MKKRIIEGTQQIRFTFDGLQDDVIFDASRAATASREYAEMHGWGARIGDTAASFKTDAERRASVVAYVEHYHAGGAWEIGRKAAPQNPAILAIAAKRGCSYAEAMVYVAEKALAEMTAE